MLVESKGLSWRYLKAAAPDGSKCLQTPFTVVVDTREQIPFSFAGIRADCNQGRLPVIVQTTRKGLASGDYSVEGFESRVAVERKGLGDLFSTLGQSRRRFQSELLRLSTYDFAAVIVEADWGTIFNQPPTRSRLNPKTIFRSVIAWRIRYPRIHWEMCPGRKFAEIVTFRLLERFWKENYKQQQRRDVREIIEELAI